MISDTQKALLVSVAAIGAITAAFFYQDSQTIKLCDQTQQCVTFSKVDFDAVRSDLANKINSGTPLSWSEMKLTSAIVTYQAKGQVVFNNVDDSNELRADVANLLTSP